MKEKKNKKEMCTSKNNEKTNGFIRAWAAFWKVIGTIILVGVLTSAIFICIFLKWVDNSLRGTVEVEMSSTNVSVSTELYYKSTQNDNWIMYQTLFMDGEDRIWVDIDDIPKYLQDAAVAIEDKRFYEHNGVDIHSTLRAIASTLTGSGVQGGSTITQQLIKNITGDNETTVKRKITEIYRAIEFEKQYSKSEILEAYLNEIYLGQSCYGVKRASERYFEKDVSELSLAECACLISITNNPSQFGPFEGNWAREQNRKRQVLVLDAMLDQEKITETEYEKAKNEEIVFANGFSNFGKYYGKDIKKEQVDKQEESKEQTQENKKVKARNSYYTDAVINDVAKMFMEKYGCDYNKAVNMVYGGGYKIYTAQNIDYQKIAESVFEDESNAPYITKSGEQLQGAITIIDPYTGRVVAMVGGIGEKTTDRGWNWATEPRQCGSATKPISVYAPALDTKELNGASVIDGSPLMVLNGSEWPKNDDGKNYGHSSIRYAIVNSVNTCAVRVCYNMGTAKSYDFMINKLGFTTLTNDDRDKVGNMALGGYSKGVTTEEMAAAYSVFANKGIYTAPTTFYKIEDRNGSVVYDNTPKTRIAIKESTAAIMNGFLSDVITTGTGRSANFDGMTMAGKTGTTNGARDRYFVGYTPYYVAACWVGYESNEKIVSGYINPAALLWKNVMSKIHQGLENKPFFECEDITRVAVCRDSGLIATTNCEQDPNGSRVKYEWVANDNKPYDTCPLLHNEYHYEP